jgi:hypothetical protein
MCLQSDHFSIAIHSVMASPFNSTRNPWNGRRAVRDAAGASRQYHFVRTCAVLPVVPLMPWIASESEHQAHNRPTLWS